jgi:hypothetical protein
MQLAEQHLEKTLHRRRARRRAIQRQELTFDHEQPGKGRSRAKLAPSLHWLQLRNSNRALR